MKTEIERKFLVAGDAWRAAAGAGICYEQGYVSSGTEKITVRVRLAGTRGFLTLKGPTRGVSRAELEYEIPAEEARYMLLNFCAGRVVSKMRYVLQLNGLTWEIDEFSGENTGLIIAEIELQSETQTFDEPGWLGEEVSYDPRYFNSALACKPYVRWKR